MRGLPQKRILFQKQSIMENTSSNLGKHAPKSAETRAKMSAAKRGNKNRLGKTKAGKRKTVSLRLAVDVLEKLTRLAAGGNRTAVLERIVREYPE